MEPPTKRYELPLFFAGIRRAVCRWKALDLRNLNKYAVTAGLAKRQKNYSSFKFLLEILEKFRSTELYDAPLEGSTIFLYRSSFGPTSMETCRLSELNMQFSAGQDVRLKSYGARSSFYRWSLSMGS